MAGLVTDSEYTVRKLRPEVEAAEKRVERLKEDVANSTAAVAERITGARVDQTYSLARLADAEEVLALLTQRPHVSTRVLAATPAFAVELVQWRGSRTLEFRKT